MTKKSDAPAIRFKGFSDAWEQRKLGDVADIVGGGTPSTGNQSYWDGDIDWYAPAEIADQIYANSSQKKITGLGYENSSAKMLPPGTVLFTSRAGIGKTAILTRKGCTNQGFQSIVPHRGELDSYFIFSRTEELKRYGELVGAGSTFVEVSGKQMAVMELMMPPTMREQQTIGGFFQQLDHLITLHQRKFEKLTNVKKSMLEKMFPQNGSSYPEIRFKGFTDPWEQRKFEEIAVRSSVICSDDTLPRVEYEDIVSGTGRLNKDIYAKQSSKSGIVFHQGDVLYGKLRPYLQNWLLPTFDGLAVGDFWVLQPQNADSSFLYRLIQSRQFDEVANQSTGTKMPRADWKLVSKTVFSIPSNISEQAAIGTYFTALDSLITLHQRKFEKLTNVKKSMLEKMFPQNGSSYPEIRFKGFTDPWEQRKVGNLLIERNQQAPMSDEYPLMAFIANEGVAPKGERYDRSALVTDTVSKLYKKTEKGDFIYSSNNLETGSIGLNKYGKACISPVYSIFEPTGIADSDFLGRRLVRKDFINAMVKWRQGVIYGQWRIHESDFLKIEIAVPSVEEQRKIGAYLDQLDNLITLHQRELEKLQNIKKSMLEKMFV